MMIMRERAQRIGGEIKVDSTPGFGTQVQLFFLNPAAMEKKSMSEQLKVVLVDDQNLCRSGLANCFPAATELPCAGTTNDRRPAGSAERKNPTC